MSLKSVKIHTRLYDEVKALNEPAIPLEKAIKKIDAKRKKKIWYIKLMQDFSFADIQFKRQQDYLIPDLLMSSIYPKRT